MQWRGPWWLRSFWDFQYHQWWEHTYDTTITPANFRQWWRRFFAFLRGWRGWGLYQPASKWNLARGWQHLGQRRQRHWNRRWRWFRRHDRAKSDNLQWRREHHGQWRQRGECHRRRRRWWADRPFQPQPNVYRDNFGFWRRRRRLWRRGHHLHQDQYPELWPRAD